MVKSALSAPCGPILRACDASQGNVPPGERPPKTPLRALAEQGGDPVTIRYAVSKEIQTQNGSGERSDTP